jgi:putative restriction endonuclease
MRFWWVNQKQTHRQEIGGGYLWSPKRRSDATRNQFYENMKIVAPGDMVFCYWESAVRAQGTLRSFGYDAPKPDEFGEAGRNWSQVG